MLHLLVSKEKLEELQCKEDFRVFWHLILANIVVGPMVVLIYFLSQAYAAALYLAGGLIGCVPVILLLLRFHKLQTAKFVFVLSCCLYIYLLSLGFDHSGSVYLLCFPVMILAFILFDSSQKVAIGLSVLMPIITWFLVSLVPNHSLDSFATFTEKSTNFFFLVDSFVAFLVMVLFLLIYNSSNERKKREEFAALKNAKGELRHAHDQLEQFFKLNMNILLIGDDEGYIKKMNPVLSKILDYSEAELQEKPFTEFVLPDDLKKSLEAFDAVLKGKPIVNFENRYRCKNGDIRIINWTCSRGPTGHDIYATAIDVTAVRDQEREKVQLFRAITQSAIFTTTDAKGKILSVNDKFCQISGYKAEELIGRDHRIINSGVHSKAFFKEMWQTISSGQVWYGEIENRAKDGHHYFVSTVVTPVMNNDGEVEKYIAIRFDRTKEHDLDVQLQSERAKSAHSAKLASLGEISSGIAHEINNPLTIISGSFKLLKHYRNDPEKFEHQCEKMDAATQRIVKIITALQRYTMPGSNLNITERTIDDIIDGSMLLVAGSASQNNVPIETSIQTKSQILCDEVEMQQVFANLIYNAIDAAKLYVERWVKIQAFEDDDEVVIQVLDSGRGIPPEIQEKLFQPFFTTKKIGHGVGLGLCVARGILDRHNGRIKVRLIEGHTCFEIRFDKVETLSVAA